LAQDRAFWRDLLARRSSSRGLPAHSAGGYRNRHANPARTTGRWSAAPMPPTLVTLLQKAPASTYMVRASHACYRS
jgi:hypothetical protein